MVINNGFGFITIIIIYLITSLKIGLNDLKILIKQIDLVFALPTSDPDFRFVYTVNALGGPRKLCTDMTLAWAVIFVDHLQLMG